MEVKTCTKCKNSKPVGQFAKNRNVCKQCAATYMRKYRDEDGKGGRPKRTVELDLAELPALVVGDGFAGREDLEQYLQRQLEETCAHFDVLIEVNRARLQAALRTRSAKDINDAEVAYRRTVVDKTSYQTKLLEKLELLQQWRPTEDEDPAHNPVVFEMGATPDKEKLVVPCAAPPGLEE